MTEKQSSLRGADDLLAGILNETQDEADAEQQRIEAELQSRRQASARQKEETEQKRRLEAESAIKAEEARRQEADIRRSAVALALEDMKKSPEQLAAERRAEGPTSADFASARLPSYHHKAIPEKRSRLGAYLAAASVLLIGGGLTAYLLATAAVPLDMTAYPKANLLGQVVTSASAHSTIALTDVWTEEPASHVPAVVTDDSGTRPRDRGDRGDQNTPVVPPSLDNNSIFNQGIERANE